MDRDFTADRPNALWLTDITEHRTDEGKLYCCAIKDVYSNRIVGYSLDGRMTAALAVSALRNAIALRQPSGTIVVHSDRGSQFRSKAFVRTLEAQRTHRIDGSGRRLRRQRRHGVVLLPAAEERAWTANAGRRREELRIAIVTWIERTYHRRRRQRVLGRLTPVEFEILETELQAA